MSMTKKDYQLVADTLRMQLEVYAPSTKTVDHPDVQERLKVARNVVRQAAYALSESFARDNPNFNRARFMSAVLAEDDFRQWTSLGGQS